MVATVLIREKNGAGETATDKTSGTVRFKNADNATVDLVNPMVIDTPDDYSFKKYLRLNISVAPDTNIDNLQCYTDGGGFGTGITVYYKMLAAFATPAAAVLADETGATDLFSKTSGSRADMDANNTGPFTGTGDKGDYLMAFMKVESTASSGTKTGETITFTYDEI